MGNYCKNCGAYIPQYSNTCLSCGASRAEREKRSVPNEHKQKHISVDETIEKLTKQIERYEAIISKQKKEELVFPAHRIEGQGTESCIDLRPLALYRTNVVLPPCSISRKLKNAYIGDRIEAESFPVYEGRSIDGKFHRGKQIVKITFSIIGEVED